MTSSTRRLPLFLTRGWAPLGLALLSACASAPPPARAPEPVRVQAPRYPTSFDCSQIEAPWQAYVCRDAELAGLDRALAPLWRRQWLAQDAVGRAELLASQRHWQLGLYPQCQLADSPAEDRALPAAPLACLKQAWRSRQNDLQTWPLPVVAAPTASAPATHPLSAYVAFRSAQSLEPALCTDMTERLNGLIARYGDPDPARISTIAGINASAGATSGAGRWQLLAGSHGAAQARLADGRTIEVTQHNAGPYGSYEQRALGLRVNGSRLIDERSVPDWMLDLPNAGGSFSSTSSQTGDYAGLDVFTLDQRVLVLVHQTWGYYASAARGESPHSALYELDGQGLQRRCLWRTYIKPPVAQALKRLPQFKALQELLDSAAGPDSMRLAPDDRRDAGLLYQEAQWTLLNMPLLGLHEVQQHQRLPLLRQRHDEALEAVFAWSERNVPSKQLYRRLMPLIPAAHAELQQAFQGGEGLAPDAARGAADLVLMAAVARAAERLQDPALPRPAPGSGAYTPRYAVAPAPGDLERGRPYRDLHSALLGRAAPEVIDDFMRHTWGSTERIGDPAKGLGPAGDTPLMAAVRSPDTLARLLAAGADAQARNAWGKTALMSAAQADQPDSVQRLLQAGADLNTRTTQWQADGAGGPDNAEGALHGRTALMYAAASAQPGVIELLLARGAERQAVDAHGKTACELLANNPRVPAGEQPRLRQLLCGTP